MELKFFLLGGAKNSVEIFDAVIRQWQPVEVHKCSLVLVLVRSPTFSCMLNMHRSIKLRAGCFSLMTVSCNTSGVQEPT